MGQKAFHSQKYPNPFKPENRNARGIFKVFQKICRRILAEGKSIGSENPSRCPKFMAWIDPTRKDLRTIHHRGRY
jgi:hypothetical protein